MGLMRSLQAGITGLRNHQLFMDVVGNNIANVNTVGFKVGRVTFSEMFAQTIRGTTQPVASAGGTNPIQVGLGMAVGTIDTIHTMGSLETTGQGTDLAIQGDGFFVLDDAGKRVYTRAGVFQFNADGVLTMPSNGLKVQGFLATPDGEIDPAAGITDIQIPGSLKLPASATNQITFNGNLNAKLEPTGSILKSGGVYAIEQLADDSDMSGMLTVDGTGKTSILNSMNPNNTSITITDGAANTFTYKYVESDASTTNNAFNSLDDLITEINNDFGAAGANSLTASLNASGQIVFTDISGAANNITIDGTDPILKAAFKSLEGDINAAATNTAQFAHIATATDLLENLINDNGVSLGLAGGDTISIDGNVGGTAVTTGTLAVVGGTTTYGDYLSQIEATLGLTNDSGVEINPEDGGLVINGDGGVIYELSDLNIVAVDGLGVSRTQFDTLFDATPGNYLESQEAKDATQSATVTVYDSLGNDFDLTLVFTKDVQSPNRWLWDVQLPDGYIANGGSDGYVEFSPDGSLSRFEYTDGSAALQFSPGSNSSPISIALNPGEQGGFEGLTQLSGANANTVILNQDGYGMGVLDRINIDQQGRINGEFSNGINQTLAQLLVANFNNPAGLIRGEGSLFEMSGNSGDPQYSTAGGGFNSVIIAGALEQSNVDLAEEFTKMIVAQRGFQANARTITVSDEMLSEVTNLKR